MVDLSKPIAAVLNGRSVMSRSGQRAGEPAGRRFESIVGRSVPMRELYRQIEMVAETDATVLVEGETGTGKNLIAHNIHRLSPRSALPLVSLNASNLQEQLFESELFGHVRGAFSGAHQDHEGLARAAQGGTLFIDEVGELSPSNQARLLQFLDNKLVRPVGSTHSHEVDVRIVAATNRNLRRAVDEGRYREDLYYRLRVIHLRVPPLRERPDDVPLLVRHFLDRYSSEHGRNVTGLSEQAWEALQVHTWPGNVRELENEIERAVVMTPNGEEIAASLLSDELRNPSGMASDGGAGLREYRRQAERRMILATLRRHGWNVSAAARDLGFSRVGLTKKMKRLGIERPR
jgi:transcriptional regulator with PAS, ATPase and Fis domain